MAEYFVHQEVMSLVHMFTISSDGKDVYRAKGNFSLAPRLVVTDNEGTEVAEVKQKLLTTSWTAFEVSFGGAEPSLTVKTQLGDLTHYKFAVEGAVNWSVTGNFSAHEFDIADTDGGIVGHVSKVHQNPEGEHVWGDAYSVKLADGAPPLEALAVVLAIDLSLTVC